MRILNRRNVFGKWKEGKKHQPLNNFPFHIILEGGKQWRYQGSLYPISKFHIEIFWICGGWYLGSFLQVSCSQHGSVQIKGSTLAIHGFFLSTIWHYSPYSSFSNEHNELNGQPCFGSGSISIIFHVFPKDAFMMIILFKWFKISSTYETGLFTA